ncbi:MAG: YdcH family protein [Pseudomonadota bacterium]
MSHVPHELADELPEYKERIHELKTSNAHFARLFDEYHELNREIHRAEAAGVNISDEHHEELKRMRLLLKDEMFAMLQEQCA